MEMEEDDSVDTRERWYRWMTEAAVHERRQARTDWLAVNREGTIVGRAAVAALNSLPKVEGCAQHLGIPVALPASAKPLAREKSERIEKCLHRNLLGKRYRCLLPSNYISCIFSIRDQPAWLSLLLFLVLLLLLTLARSALSRS